MEIKVPPKLDHTARWSGWVLLTGVTICVFAGVFLLMGKIAARYLGVQVADAMGAAQAIILAFGLTQVYLLYKQDRKNAKWHKLLSYHTYFADCPSAQRVEALYAALGELEALAAFKGSGAALDPDTVGKILDCPTKSQAIRKYLDGFEQLAAAINCGVVDGDYAFGIEGTRVTRTYTIFAPLIRKLQEQNFRAYLELASLADAWMKERDRLFMEVQEKHESMKRGSGIRRQALD